MESYILPIATALVSCIGTYIVAKSNNKKDNEQFFVSKMQEMFQEQQEEIRGLKEEIRQLTQENYELRIEILSLRDELQRHKSNENVG